MEWLQNNAGTIAVAAVVACMVAALVIKLIGDKKKGKSSCGCGCGGCAMRDKCHPEQPTDDQNNSHT